MQYVVKRIREYLGLSQKEFAEKLGTSFATINRCENGHNKLSKLAQDSLIKLCNDNDIPAFDFILEKIANEEKACNIPDNRMVLYHGSKSGVEGKIMPSSRSECDFGKGFYLGTIPRQPLTLVCSFNKSKFYIVSLPKSIANSFTFHDDIEWAMFIAFNRKKMKDIQGTSLYKKYQNLMTGYDFAIGSIANDRMYRVLDDFFEGVVTDAALISCLSVLKLGKQYVCLNEAACRQVKIEKEIELSFFEKEIIQKASADYRQKGLKLTDEMYKKNRRAGNYFDEILGEAN
ncbi:MAG: DUF3990 domain-containing protein [Clostridia bacterium]|nr:DUF3990 domain-containing protein [Clostridia bacterium]